MMECFDAVRRTVCTATNPFHQPNFVATTKVAALFEGS